MLWQKINCIFRIIINGLDSELRHTFDEAFTTIRSDTDKISTSQLYVFPSKTRCPYREHMKISHRIAEMDKASEEFRKCMSDYMKNLLNTRAIISLHAAFEMYLITHVEDICLTYNNVEDVLGVSYIKPEQEDSFESDRLCARIANLAPVFSEDFDCVVLFGAKSIILEVRDTTVRYISIDDLLDIFESNSREELLHKCIIMGTDYNIGMIGMGPMRIREIDVHTASNMAAECMLRQSLDISSMRRFFCL
jgi:hypothetical protein